MLHAGAARRSRPGPIRGLLFGVVAKDRILLMPMLVATDREVVVVDVERGTSALVQGITDRPTCLAADSLVHGRVWCGTHRGGVFRSDDGGRSWRSVGLAGRRIMSIA